MEAEERLEPRNSKMGYRVVLSRTEHTMPQYLIRINENGQTVVSVVLKPPPAAIASHIRICLRPSYSLSMQFPATALEKVVEGDPGVWALAPTWKT